MKLESKRVKGICLAFFAFMLVFMVGGSKNVYAASDYKAESYNTYSNGKYKVYIQDEKLYQKTISTGKVKVLTKLGKLYDKNDDVSVSISAYYGGNFYIYRGSFNNWNHKTYYYNLKSGKLKLASDKCSIEVAQGKYAIVTPDFRTDVSPASLYLYKLTKSGMKKVKLLTKHGFSSTIIGSKVYYVDNPNKVVSDWGTYYDMKKAVLYRTNFTGKAKTKIATFNTEGEYGEVIVSNITKNTCDVSMNSNNYTYIYKTKKLVRK